MMIRLHKAQVQRGAPDPVSILVNPLHIVTAEPTTMDANPAIQSSVLHSGDTEFYVTETVDEIQALIDGAIGDVAIKTVVSAPPQPLPALPPLPPLPQLPPLPPVNPPPPPVGP